MGGVVEQSGQVASSVEKFGHVAAIATVWLGAVTKGDVAARLRIRRGSVALEIPLLGGSGRLGAVWRDVAAFL